MCIQCIADIITHLSMSMMVISVLYNNKKRWARTNVAIAEVVTRPLRDEDERVLPVHGGSDGLVTNSCVKHNSCESLDLTEDLAELLRRDVTANLCSSIVPQTHCRIATAPRDAETRHWHIDELDRERIADLAEHVDVVRAHLRVGRHGTRQLGLSSTTTMRQQLRAKTALTSTTRTHNHACNATSTCLSN